MLICAETTTAPKDVLDSLHAVFTRNGIASYTDYPHLATDIVHWACEMYRQSKMPPPAAPAAHQERTELMTNQEEAAKVWRNLKGDCGKVAHYIVERCGDFVFDQEREVFIAEFLRATTAAHQETPEPMILKAEITRMATARYGTRHLLRCQADRDAFDKYEHELRRLVSVTAKGAPARAAEWQPLTTLVETWKTRRDTLWPYNRSPDDMAEVARHARASELDSVVRELEKLLPPCALTGTSEPKP